MAELIEAPCADGWRLQGELRVSSTPPRRVAVVSHALMVDRRTLDRPVGEGLISFLAAHETAVISADLRGHGKSEPRAEQGGDWTYDDLIEQDVPALLNVAKERFGSLPRFMIGHSLFAHAALAHLARHPDTAVDGLVMLAGNTCNPDWRQRPFGWMKKRVLIETMGLFASVSGRFPARRLRLGSNDEPRGFIKQFLRGARQADWIANDGFSYSGALPQVKVPVLSLVGAGDRLFSPPEDVRGLSAQIPNARVEVVGRATGLPFDPGHMELLLDPRAQPAWQHIIEFLNEHS